MSSATNGPAGARRPRAGHANGPELLAEKLRVPRLSLAILRRRRLTDLIDQAAGHRVTVVSGPAGAGKTVACGSWASAGPASRRVAWLTLDAGDRDPARFWSYVQAALTRAGGAPADAVGALRPQQVPAAGPPPPPAPAVPVPPPVPAGSADDFALRLAEAAQLLTEPVTLVLDDAHELTGGPVLAGLDLLIRHAPPALRLILIGRCPPPLQLARLRLSGDLADVTAADLACAPEEADAYFAMLGLAVDRGARDELLRRTEGWMAGLRLAAMGAASRAETGCSGPIACISGAEPLVTDYLWDEVLGRQPLETRLFMLRTSVTEQTSGDLADALTGGPGGARTLERLSRENSFVETVGHGGAVYRYHTLLREVLAAERARQIPQEIPILLRRAARWHAAHDQAIDALRCAARAGDWDYAARTLAEAAAAALVRSGVATLEDVLDLFPAQSRADDAAVAAALAAARLWHGDPDGAAHHLDTAERVLGRRRSSERRIIEPWLAALRVMQAASRSAADPGLLARGWTLAEQGQAIAGTQPEHRALGLLWFALGSARLRRWEIGAGRYALNHASLQLAAGGLGELCARARGWQALAEAWYGDLAAAEKILGECRPPADGDPGSSCLAALASAQVSLARDDLGSVRKLLDDCGEHEARELQLPGEPDLVVVAGLIRARAALAGDDATGARAIVLRLRDAGAPVDPPLERLLMLLDCEIAVRTGDTGRARMTLLPRVEGAEADRADCRLMLGRLLLSEGDFPGATDAVAPIIDGTATEVTIEVKVAALVVAAVASRRAGRTATAAELVQQALALAEPDDASRVFLDAGQSARSAITVLIPPTSRGAGFAGRILERFDTQLPHADGQLEKPAVLLTDSELAVLRFLPSHLTNQEIAEALFLSINTVKTHLRAAYRKLGVASRRAAIARARRLDLILATARRLARDARWGQFWSGYAACSAVRLRLRLWRMSRNALAASSTPSSSSQAPRT
jgi:LuxR family transcriptional regulator, maltose regulon positive regulatory protein